MEALLFPGYFKNLENQCIHRGNMGLITIHEYGSKLAYKFQSHKTNFFLGQVSFFSPDQRLQLGAPLLPVQVLLVVDLVLQRVVELIHHMLLVNLSRLHICRPSGQLLVHSAVHLLKSLEFPGSIRSFESFFLICSLCVWKFFRF